MSKYFNYHTDPMLACPCCGVHGMSEDFLAIVDGIRLFVGRPLRVSSGYRCPAYNKLVSNTGFAGPHTTGLAIDLACYGAVADKVIEASYHFGILGRGIAQKGPHRVRFVHLDQCTEITPRPWVWSY